jgi:hypothetical protein
MKIRNQVPAVTPEEKEQWKQSPPDIQMKIEGLMALCRFNGGKWRNRIDLLSMADDGSLDAYIASVNTNLREATDAAEDRAKRAEAEAQRRQEWLAKTEAERSAIREDRKRQRCLRAESMMGKPSTHCRVCGRRLTDAESKACGVGPECRNISKRLTHKATDSAYGLHTQPSR